MGLTMTFPGVMVKVKWSTTCSRAWHMWNTFVTGMFLSGVPPLIDCDIITETLATVAACFSKDFTPYILRNVFMYVLQFQRRLPTLTMALRPRSVFEVPGPGIRETRTSVWTPAAWLPLPDWPQRMSPLSDSLSLIWAETGEDRSELRNSDLASAAWVQSHLWRDAEGVSRYFTIINKASRT